MSGWKPSKDAVRPRAAVHAVAATPRHFVAAAVAGGRATILGRVAARRKWRERFDFWRSMPASAHAFFLAGVFAIFLPAGILTDIPLLGANPPARLLCSALLSGTLAVAYAFVIPRYRYLTLPLVATHVLVVMFFDRLAGPVGAPLEGAALRARMSAEVQVSTSAIIIGFVLFSQLFRREGVRWLKANAEIELASDIHRLLVPRIERRIGAFEFRGVSMASGAVGGDLLDVTESPSGWTGYVADVSGHGVAAGLLMGMTKSTASTQVQGPVTLDSLLEPCKSVLHDVTMPAVLATVAGSRVTGA